MCWRIHTAFLCGILLPLCAVADEAPEPDAAAEGLPAIAEFTKDMEAHEGFVDVFADNDNGALYAVVPAAGGEFIYATGLSSGLGSNPVGLDRGQWGTTRLVRAQVIGRRVFLVSQNLRYRATSSDTAERNAVDESFADSVFWSGEIQARSGEQVLVDLTTLLLRDAHGVVATLKSTGQGDFSLASELSYVDVEDCRTFPDNTELNAVVTYRSTNPGELVRATSADGETFSLRLHHSFVRLPPPGYQPRVADPGVGSFAISFADYSAPLDRPLERRWIARHRLQKADPTLERSPPVEPIVYYLDPGTPQPVRAALLDGARWWNAAFEAAGFVDAFQVRMLPEDVDPMDVRYNVIQWVHRSTRGWSYGQSITDPRTGEIIKGHVLLGSLRVRQDRLIVDGLTASTANATWHAPHNLCRCCGIAGAGVGESLALFDPQRNPIDVSLARLRQLSAHEVGHTIGFAHNFAASTYADRASVMDYPAPRVRITDDGALDLSDAYGVGVGAWDRFMVRYAYTEYSGAEAEREGLDALLAEARAQGFLYLTDSDARPAGAAHPRASLWDNGADPIAELRHLMRVRRLALDKLGTGDLLPGQTLSELETVLVPVYLYHRYQVDATAKVIGGFDYDRGLAGAPHQPVVAEDRARQQDALAALLDTIEPEELKVPDRLLTLLSPAPWSSSADRERFAGRTAMIFDPDAVAEAATEHVLGMILHPQRAARLEAYATDDWNLQVVLDQISERVMQPVEDAPNAQLRRITQHVYIRQLIALAGNMNTSHAVRSAAHGALVEFQRPLGPPELDDGRQKAHRRMLAAEVRRFLSRPAPAAGEATSLEQPPGSPIGQRPE